MTVKGTTKLLGSTTTSSQKILLFWIQFSVLVFQLGCAAASSEETSLLPNVIILFADNLGYADISYFGAPTAQTPNIDRLGREGIKLNHWNSVAHLCSASRAALLTGLYPIRTGVYPGVFQVDAARGLIPTVDDNSDDAANNHNSQPGSTKTLAKLLKERYGYATSIVGKWHLGHRPQYLPTTNHGFDEWLGIPYHMSGGSLDNHQCVRDVNETLWLPLYSNEKIIQQPVQVQNLAQNYADTAKHFIRRNVDSQTPFFLYMSFSHVHQLCAAKHRTEPRICQWTAAMNASQTLTSSFVDAVEEMDWIAGQILDELDERTKNNTLVIFTSDNGPWVAEQSCSGSKGPFEGRWLRDNVHLNCTACPKDYEPNPTSDRPRRCTLMTPDHATYNTPKANNNTIHHSDQQSSIDGIHCGEDTGLGSLWEANLRMPALASWPGKIQPGTETNALVSTLDVVPTVLSILENTQSNNNGDMMSLHLDGIDISSVLFGKENEYESENRTLFFWRDGFEEGPLGPPYGKFEVVAVKIGHFKAWFWTKSAHYNADRHIFHDPPLLFDTNVDPAEAFPLDIQQNEDLQRLVQRMKDAAKDHKNGVEWTFPLTLERDPRYVPCVDGTNGCRTAYSNIESTSFE